MLDVWKSMIVTWIVNLDISTLNSKDSGGCLIDITWNMNIAKF